jgi:hypothetical protein
MLPIMPIDLHLFFTTFFLLLFGHCLGDFPLQGEYLSRTKNPQGNPTAIWVISLFVHCMIHAGIVFLLTGQIRMAVIMFVTHAGIDLLKCNGDLGEGSRGYLHDQILHVIVIAIITALYCG